MPRKSSSLSLGSGLPVTDEEIAQLFNATLQKIELGKQLIQDQANAITAKMESDRFAAR